MTLHTASVISTFRHVLLKNTPWIPLDFLVNDKKLKESSSDRIQILKGKRIPIFSFEKWIARHSLHPLFFASPLILILENMFRRIQISQTNQHFTYDTFQSEC